MKPYGFCKSGMYRDEEAPSTKYTRGGYRNRHKHRILYKKQQRQFNKSELNGIVSEAMEHQVVCTHCDHQFAVNKLGECHCPNCHCWNLAEPRTKRTLLFNKILATLLLLLLPSLGWGQAVVVGEFPPPDKIKEARYTLATAEPKALTLNVGEFEIIEPAKTLTGVPLYWHISDASIMQRIDVAANQAYGLWMKRRGEPEAKLHLFPARPVAWVILVGAKQGTSNIAIIRNGLTSSDPPAVVDTVAVTVGTPKPPPPPPDTLNDFEKSIKKAMEADIAAGKGSKTHAELLAGIYRGAANSLPASVTAGELYSTLQKAISSAGIPSPAQSLPTMRALIAAELNKKLPTESDKQLTLEDRNRITATFGAMADSLEAILK